MLLATSGMVFILLTALFGVSYNLNTGKVSFGLSPGDDWLNPMVGKPGENDDTAVNPMNQYPWFCWLAMILGYFIAYGIFIYFWLQYCRWRWLHVPEELRFIEKKKKIGGKEKYVGRRNTEND